MGFSRKSIPVNALGFLGWIASIVFSVFELEVGVWFLAEDSSTKITTLYL
jgi:hypothetical protein